MKTRQIMMTACLVLTLGRTPLVHAAGWGWISEVIAYIQAHRDLPQAQKCTGPQKAAPATAQRLPAPDRGVRKEGTP